MAITFLLPTDDCERPLIPLAPGLPSWADAAIGVVDNGLWRSMNAAISAIGAEAGRAGARVTDSIPFDHLAPDFAEQQAEVSRLATRVQAVVTGLGN